MGLTRRPIRYLSGLSPIQALSLSCLITYSGSDIGGRVHKRHVRVQPRWIERCTRPCWTTTHTCTYTRYTQGGGVSTIRRISVRERPVLITSRATAVRKGFDFQIPSSLPPLLLLPRSMEEETRVWEFRVRSLGRSYRDCKSLSHSLNPPLDYSERESRPIERVCVYVYVHEAVQVLLCVLFFGRKRSSGGRTNDRGGARQVLSSFAFQLSGSFRSPLLEYFRKSNCPPASLVGDFS